MKIAVLMTCYNRVERTLRSIKCLERAATEVEVDVYLVDDASPDMTGKVVSNWWLENGCKCRGIKNIKVIQGAGDLYWARGMNLAWRNAMESRQEIEALQKYNFFLWLNDDVELFVGAISGMIKDWEGCKGVVSGLCKEPNGDRTSYGATDAGDAKLVPNGKPQLAEGWLNGNCVLIPREVYEKVGIISDEFSHARADCDYGERIKEEGLAFYASSAYVGTCHNDFERR